VHRPSGLGRLPSTKPYPHILAVFGQGVYCGNYVFSLTRHSESLTGLQDRLDALFFMCLFEFIRG
jgi:hypothetical protein